jgi:hypothetical protein
MNISFSKTRCDQNNSSDYYKLAFKSGFSFRASCSWAYIYFCSKFTYSFCKLDHFNTLGKIAYNYERVQITNVSGVGVYQQANNAYGSFTLVRLLFDNASNIVIRYCLPYLPRQLGSFLFLSHRPRWPRKVRKAWYCWCYQAKFCQCKHTFNVYALTTNYGLNVDIKRKNRLLKVCYGPTTSTTFLALFCCDH